MEAAAYVRRSTTDQESSLQIQREMIAAYAEQRGYSIVQWYEDDGISGDSERRPGFQAIIADAKAGNFKAILCRNKSRFSRFKASKAIRYFDVLDSAGVRFETVEEGVVDVDDLGSMIVTSVDSHANKKFLTDLSSNTIRGQAAKVKNGSVAGQRAPYGYDRMYVDEQGIQKQRVKAGEKFSRPDTWTTTFVVSDDSAIVDRVQWMFETYLKTSTGVRGIAHKLNEMGIPSPKGGMWSPGTIREILRNRAYIGEYQWNERRYGKHNSFAEGQAVVRSRGEIEGDKALVCRNDKEDMIIRSGAHTPIVDVATFDAVQVKLAKRAKSSGNGTSRKRRRPYLLSGRLICKHCGSKMHGTSRTKKKSGKSYQYRKYLCSGHHQHGTTVCTHNQVDAVGIETQVIERIVGKLEDPATRNKLEAVIRRKLQAKERTPSPASDAQLSELDKKINNLVKRLAEVPDALVDTVLQQLNEFKRQRDTLGLELDKASSEPAGDTEALVQDALAALDDLAEKFTSLDPHTVQDAVHSAVSSVVLEFQPIPQGKRTGYRCTAGIVNLSSPDGIIAGTGFNLNLRLIEVVFSTAA